MPKPEYYVGEALIGESPNLAHIDLIIGSKDGPIGISFANALTRSTYDVFPTCFQKKPLRICEFALRFVLANVNFLERVNDDSDS